MTDLFPRRPTDKLGPEDPEVVERLQEQEEHIQDLRQMMEFQVNIQTSLVREIECLKDQVDLLREQWHNHSDSSGCRFEEEDSGERIGNLASLASLVQQPPSLLEHSYTVSQPSLALYQSIPDLARLEEKSREMSSSSSKLKPLVKVVKKKLSRDLPGAVALVSGPGQGRESGGEQQQHIYVNNYDYADFYHQTQDKSRPPVKSAKARDGVYSAESDSGLDVTPEGTPYTSRPESELLISEDKQDDDVKASPRQLEIMMKESSSTGKTDR